MAFFTTNKCLFYSRIFLFLFLWLLFEVGRLPGDLEVGDGPILGPNRTGGLLLVKVVNVSGKLRVGRREDPVRSLKSGAEV